MVQRCLMRNTPPSTPPQAGGGEPADATILLRKCLGNWSDDEVISALIAASAADWESLYRQSLLHQVSPLLHRRLRALSDRVTIPLDIPDKLKACYLSESARAVRITHHLTRLLTAFQEVGIPVILLKGAHLATQVYPDPALRTMDDVDLLVWQSNLYRSRQIVENLKQQSPGAAIRVDLHWSIESGSSPFSINPDDLWQRARPVVIDGVEARTLSPEDLLLHLCLHGIFRHLYAPIGLRLFCDLAVVLERYGDEINWEELARLADEWGAGNVLRLAFRLLDEALNVKLSSDVATLFELDDPNRQLTAIALPHLLDPASYRGSAESPYFFQALSGGWREAVRRLWRSGVPNRDVISGKFDAAPGSARWWRWYLFRTWRVCRISVRSIWRATTERERMKPLLKLNRWMAKK